MKVSCIIPTRDRNASLARTVKSLVASDYSPSAYEIIIVDNGSTDATAEVVQQSIRDYPEHRILYFLEPVPGLLSGRHRGVLESDGDVLVFVDDDIQVAPSWLRAIEEALHDPSVQLVCGPSLPRYESPPPDWLEGFWTTTLRGGRFCHWLSLLDLGCDQMEVHPNFVWGLNFSIRRQALLALGGFHPDSIPKHLQYFQGDGETGLTLKAFGEGYRAIYQPNALVHHDVPRIRLTAEYFERRAYFQGICDSYTELRRRALAKVPGIQDKSNLLRFANKVTGKATKIAKKVSGALLTASPSVRRLDDQNPEFSRVHKLTLQSYQAGYHFHQAAIRRMPGLLEWITKPDYWDYRLPLIAPNGENKAPASTSG